MKLISTTSEYNVTQSEPSRLDRIEASLENLIRYQQAEAREWRQSWNELKQLQQAEAREWRIQRESDRTDWTRRFNQQNSNWNQRFDQENAEWRNQMEQQNAEWRAAMRESYDNMVRMLMQFSEEAAADRKTIRDMVIAMFRHQSTGG